VRCNRRNLRSCGAELSVKAAGALLRSRGPTTQVEGGSKDDVRPLPLGRGLGLSFWSLVLGLHGCEPSLAFMVVGIY
jgi:hypothetical protein